VTGEKLTDFLNPEEKLSVERSRRTCELLERSGDEYSYVAHAAHFFRRAIHDLEGSKDISAWDRLHLELGGHAAVSGDEELLRQCFNELSSAVAKWRLFETSDRYTDTYLPLEDLITLGELRAIAEKHDYGALVGIEEVILEMSQDSMDVEELKAKVAELSLLRQQAQDTGQSVVYFEPWHEPQPSSEPRLHAPLNIADIAAHMSEGKTDQARRCYGALVGGDNFYTAAYSNPEENLRAALFMARHDKVSDVLSIVEPGDGYFHGQIVEAIHQYPDPKTQYEVIRGLAATGIFKAGEMPWSLSRVQRVIEIAELLQEYVPSGYAVPYDVEEKLYEVWKMVSATTDIKSTQRLQAYQDISPLVRRRPIGLDTVEATRALFLGGQRY
jgi:hypothetical protein